MRERVLPADGSVMITDRDGVILAHVPRPGPLRSMAGRGGWLLLVAVAVGLLAALAITGRLLDRKLPSGAATARPGEAASVAPVQVGGKAECPPASPVRASTDHRS